MQTYFMDLPLDPFKKNRTQRRQSQGQTLWVIVSGNGLGVQNARIDDAAASESLLIGIDDFLPPVSEG